MPAARSCALQWLSNAVPCLAWDFRFSGIQSQLSCHESLCPESLFPHRLSGHTCLFFSSSYPRLSLSFFVMLLHFRSSLGLDAEAKVVKGGKERIYSFNYRDSLNQQQNKRNTYHCSSPAILAWQKWFSVRDIFFRALTPNLICSLGYVIAQNVLMLFCWKDFALCNSFCSDSSSLPSGSSKWKEGIFPHEGKGRK